MNDIWKRGYFAFIDGISFLDNPYEGDEESSEWACGWDAAQNDEMLGEDYP